MAAMGSSVFDGCHGLEINVIIKLLFSFEIKGTMIVEQKNLSPEEALALMLQCAKPCETEKVGVVEASGRVLAEDVVSEIDVIPFDNAAMDGFAVRRADLENASENNPVTCDVIAEVPAGSFYDGEIKPGEVVRIMTGAAVPKDADAVVKYEIVDYLNGDGMTGSKVAFSAYPKEFDNIRRAGEDVKAGEVVVAKGEVLSVGGVGFVANCGVDQVQVYKRPKVGIVSIGSELQAAGEPLKQGHIYESNSYALMAAIADAGGIPTRFGIVEDNFDALCGTIEQACADFDFVVTSGGASNGDFDYIKQVIEKIGELKFTLVNMRPGKCQTFGLVNETPVMGLPGNPAAAFCGFEILIRPTLLSMQGHTSLEIPTFEATLACDRKKRDTRRMYLRGFAEKQADGRIVFSPAKNQSSGIYGPIQQSNALAILPEGKVEGGKVLQGTTLTCIPFGVKEGAVI